MYAEFRNDYYNEEENFIAIDGWKTADDNEEGSTVAFVYPEHVVYVDNGVRLNEEVSSLIVEAQERLAEYDYYSQIVGNINVLQDKHPTLCFDVLKRASDWIASGGTRNSNYIKTQLAVLNRAIEKYANK